jgi:hypothetical protein
VHDADTQSEHAIMRLLVIKRPESIALVVDTLKDPSPLLRRYAVQDLGFYLRACPPDVADTIANMQVHDPDERVRAAASVATRQIAQWTAIVHPEIARQAREQAQAREAALQAAQALARRDAALPLLTDANPRHRASALIDLRGDPPADRIIPLLSDEDPVVRRQLDTELATNPLLVTRIKALGSPGVNALTLAALDSASARAALRSIQPPPSIVSSAVAQPTVVVAPAPAFSPLGWLGELSWYGALICLVGFAIAVIVQLARTGRLTTLLAPGAAPPVPDWLRELPPTAQVAPAPSQPGP